MKLPELPSFSEFFHALWGFDPYPWQARLADQVAAGDWPEAIGVPTGTGKTSALDVAVWALALEAERDPAERRAPRRVVVVVDRRTLVDQAFERAVLLRDRLLAAPANTPLGAVAARLRSLMGAEAERESPVAVALLRGGLPRDDGWARRPDQPLLAVSTVDQVGSRLFFRGYGVRPTMASVHAGLLAQDTLLLLDEVHLARPFEESLLALLRYRGWAERPLPDRFRFVRLSATGGPGPALGLNEDDLAYPALLRRLQARKPVELVEVASPTHRGLKGRVASPAPAWVEALREQVLQRVKSGRTAVGAVVNRVDTARALASALQAEPSLDVLLVTGRMRPCDREEVLAEVLRRVGPDRERTFFPGRPCVVVATQCIEAGADLDFDALVTEVASLDALVQRMGRANRTGRQVDAPVVVMVPELGEDDPVYGRCLPVVRDWLRAQGAWDAATLGLPERIATAPSGCFPERVGAAVVLPAHLDLLAQTGPVPEPDPDPAGYLHGLSRSSPEVQLVWRADVPLDPAAADGGLAAAAARLEAVPPNAFEAVSVPLAAARRWLRGEEVESFADAGALPEQDEYVRRTPPVGWLRGRDGWVLASAADLYPGACLVLPSSHGGLAAGNFDPSAQGWVTDRGDLGATLRSGRPTARLDPRVHGALGEDGRWCWPPGVAAPPAVPDGEERSLRAGRAQVREWLQALPVEIEGPLGLLRRQAPRLSIEVVEGTWVLQGRLLSREALLALGRGKEDPVDTALTADDRSSSLGRAVPLDEHLAGVESWARSFGQALGLPEPLREDLARAGRWHDLGKADPRFQVVLHGGDEIRAAGGPLLAKSGGAPLDAGRRERLVELAGLPAGFRHEMASVALLTGSAAGRAVLEGAHDRELVLHLVASHHGHARPFAPVEDHRGQPADLTWRVQAEGRELVGREDAAQDRLDSGVAERFFALNRRYGWWGLAWLEALLRLADHRESEAEARVGGEGA